MTVPIALSTANRASGISVRPATMDAKARTTGIIRATGMAQEPRPARNRSARSTSERVISTYRPTLSTSGRPPQRPTAKDVHDPASSASEPMMITSGRLRCP